MDEISPELITTLYRSPNTAYKLSLLQWQKVILVLRHHQLLARYQQRFVQKGVFDALPEYCRRHFRNAKVIADNHNLHVAFEARELTTTLIKRTEYFIFLKGASYSLSNHPVGIGRIYSDIDVLVDAPSIVNVESQLYDQGWLSQPVSDYDDRYYRKWAHEIPPMRQSTRGTIIDIHHNIVPPISGRAPDVQALINEVIKSPEGYFILSPAAMTLHSLVHLFFNEDMKRGFRDLIDLDILMSTNTDTNYWQTLARLAAETGFELELFLACRYTHLTFGTIIPENINEGLNKYKPKNLKLLDFMFSRILTPEHPYARSPFFSLAELMVLLRGHWLKMPLHILTYHLCAKGFISLTKMLLGKHFFEREVDKT
ncbi:MAG: hypothetical protein ACI81A_002354 [Paraglaciecola sp.]|jgi:hypothetical protein